MRKNYSRKTESNDKLTIFMVDLREFMLARDDDTLFTERELAARIVNSMIMSLTLRNDDEHRHIVLLGMHDDNSVSNEGCQQDLVTTAADYKCHIRGVNVREFSTATGLCKLNCPFWLQAPFDDGKIISLNADTETPLWHAVVFDLISKWQKLPVNFIFVTSKNRVPDLESFMDFMSTLVTNGFPQLEWGVIDTSEWRMFDPIMNFMPVEAKTQNNKKKRKGK